MQFVKPTPFKEALAKLGQRTVVTSRLNSEQWRRVPLLLRERAFFASEIESARFLQRGRGALADWAQAARETLPDGQTVLKTGSRADFIKQMQDFALAEGMGPLDPDDAGTIKDIRAERRLALIFDVQTRQMNDFGYWQQGMDPAVLHAFPAMRFIREKQVKEPRDTHFIHENEVQLKSNLGFWMTLNRDFGVPWGPWGWGCGHTTEDVRRKEAEKLGLLKPGEKIQPPDLDLNERLQASVQNLDSDLQKELKEAFGDQVVIKDGEAHWKGQRKKKAAPKAPEPAPEPVQEPAQPASFPEAVEGLETVQALGGSTGATLVRDPNSGALFVLKKGNSAAHIREEIAADDLYRALGVPVPEARLYETGSRPTKLARYVEGQTLNKLTGEAKAAAIARVQENFAADALLGNWDVGGTGLDNIIVDKAGLPWRIDNGGALRFRAQGKKKTDEEWNAFPTDLWSMRDGTFPVPAEIFSGLNIFTIARQIQKIDADKLLKAAPADLKDVLQARLTNLKDIGAKALEYETTKFKASYADDVVKNMMGLRKADAFSGMAEELIQAHPGDVRPLDKDGNPFDLLRTPKGKAKTDLSQMFYGDILEGAKTINHHHGQGDSNYNVGKINKAVAHKTALEALLGVGSLAQKQMAVYYLDFVDKIQKSQGNLSSKIPTITKFQLPDAGAATPRTSVTARLAQYMNAHGGDWSIVEAWADSQAGSSQSDLSIAVKYRLLKNLEAKAKDFYRPPEESAYQRMKKKYGDKFDHTFSILHAATQEVLARVKFTGNDQAARLVRILRTETTTSAVPFAKGEVGDYKRGVNESGSVFAPAMTGVRTVSVIPHSRITSLYFFERTPGVGDKFLYGDSENEFTYIAFGYNAKNLGSMGDVNLSPGTDSSKWEIK